jgi:hypothetical protein
MAVKSRAEETTNGKPTMLQPEALAKAKEIEVDPVVREQGLPEKQDDRFMDRWTLDWARDMGERVVRRLGLRRLQEGTEDFGEWRAQGHEVRRRQEDSADKVEIATSDAHIAEQKRRAEVGEARATLNEDRADGYAEKAKSAEEGRMALSPALRGSRADIYLLTVASVVLFAVDILILHQALGLVTGSDWEHWLTAGLLGAGIVVIGEIVGWAAAAAVVRGRGKFEVPAEKVAIAIALIVLMTILFFVALGIFRADSLSELAKIDGLPTSSPGFFTLAQILFFVGAAASCFSYIARTDGRLLLNQFKEAVKDEKERRDEAIKYRDEAEQAHRAVGEAPIRRKAAEARLASREALVAAQAQRDRQQAKYLKPLLEVEYLTRRAEVESGLRYWTFARGRQVALRLRSFAWILHPGLTFAVLTAGVTYAAMGKIEIAVTAGLAVLLAIWMGRLVSRSGDEKDDESPAPEIVEEVYVAQVRPEPLPKDSPQATEIERLVRRREEDRNGDSESRVGHDSGRTAE